MKKYLFVIFILIVFFLFFLFIKKDNKLLTCQKTSWQVNGEMKDEYLFIKEKGNIEKVITNASFTSVNDNFTEDYYNYVNNREECYDIKRNDNNIKYSCKYNLIDMDFYNSILNDKKEATFDNIINYFNNQGYSCLLKEDK